MYKPITQLVHTSWRPSNKRAPRRRVRVAQMTSQGEREVYRAVRCTVGQENAIKTHLLRASMPQWVKSRW